MVVVRIQEGLGNQLFQYAAGLALSKRLNTELYLDLSKCNNNKIRPYKLDHFRIQKRELKSYESFIVNKTLLLYSCGFIRFFPINYFFTIIDDRGSRETNIFHNISGKVYLLGYWQSSKYHIGAIEEIKNSFLFKNDPTEKNKLVITKMNSCESVALHVRRGDYLAHSKISSSQKVLSIDYYNRAISYINKTAKNPEYFVFSDDIAWCKNNIRTFAPTTFVSHNSAEDSQEDLRLMTHARHFIIANSTFSWWGAYLRKFNGGTVIAPKQWSFSSYNQEIYLPSWIVI